MCHIHPAIRVPLLQRRHVLHIRGRDEPLLGPGKRAHLRDLNARTGLQPDFPDTQGSKYINNKLTVINNTFSHIHRNNHDHTVNKNGKDLLQLCRSLGLYIINGRLRGDTLGRFTFCSPLGNSTVDYMITDIDPSSLRSFTVRELTPLSNHSQITAYLKKTENNINTKPSKLYNIRKPYRWAENSAEEYQKALSSSQKIALIIPKC